MSAAIVLGDVANALVIARQIMSLVRQGVEAHEEIQKIAAAAAAEGRTNLTPSEWEAVLGGAQAARDELAKKLGAV